MQRNARLALLGLTLLLVLFPLVLTKPGWPGGLKADEPAYLLMAQSLAFDFDLVADTGDLRRLFDAYPYGPVHNLILMTDDGWRTVYFGKPYIYSLFAAPAVRLFGPSGMVAFNMALLLGMVWLGYRYLRRHNDDGVSALFAAGFFLVSVGFAYAFWIHPEVFCMAAVMVSLHLLFATNLTDIPGGRGTPVGAPDGGPPEPADGNVRWLTLRAAASGGALALAVYNKPMLALLGLPALWLLLRSRRWGATAAWIGGALATSAVVAGIAFALTGHPSSYLGVTRGGFTACSPEVMPVAPAPEVTAAPGATPGADGAGLAPAVTSDEAAAVARGQARARGAASWGWLLRVPDFDLREVAERLGYFLWGRHTGLLLYEPFSLLVLLLFAAHARRSVARWVLLASIAGVAFVFLLWIPQNWHGGGGFVGNRYFVYAYPAMLFLVTRVAPAWTSVVGYALGGLLVGPILFTPLGRAVPFPTLQAHVRNWPLRLFPLELSLKGVPGYASRTYAGIQVTGRNDVVLPRGDQLWIHGATPVELLLQSPTPLGATVLEIASPAAPNTVELAFGDVARTVTFESGQQGATSRFELTPETPTRVRWIDGQPLYVYRLAIRAATGAVQPWTLEYPPRECFAFPWPATSEESFYVGAELRILGSPERLAANVYGIEWRGATAPIDVPASSRFHVTVRAINRSAAVWPVDPPARVAFAYHWLEPGGGVVVWDGVRSPLPGPVEPGAATEVELEVLAPDAPGSYLLAIDPVFEGVAWFSDRNGGNLQQLPIVVTPAATPPATVP